MFSLFAMMSLTVYPDSETCVHLLDKRKSVIDYRNLQVYTESGLVVNFTLPTKTLQRVGSVHSY